MSAVNPDEAGGFTSALEIARRGPRRYGLVPSEVLPPEAFQVRLVMDKATAIVAWDQFLDLKALLMNDPACFDLVDGKKSMNRTGATRLATAFGISLEVVHADETVIGEDRRFTFRVRASKGPRYADGVGSSRISEIVLSDAEMKKPESLGKREHFAQARGSTRAMKRAIADLVGGTEDE